jgi:hypothetical protein
LDFQVKPIVRWTAGKCTDNSIRCLQISIKNFHRIYGKDFDLVVLTRSENIPQFDEARVVKQKPNVLVSCDTNGPQWKITPSRLNKNTHELFIDNDLVIYRRSNLIEKFFSEKDMFIATEGLRRRFGSYDSLIPCHLKINTGLFGIPPGFDFDSELRNNFQGVWSNWFDEQGLVSSILVKNKLNVIPFDDISVCVFGKDENEEEIVQTKFGRHGSHFIGLNQGNSFCFDQFIKYLKHPLI